MATIAVIAKDEGSRRELRLAVEELGHRAAPAADLKGGLELLRAERPRLLIVAVEPSETTAEAALVELEREAPLMPVVAAFTKRNAARALELLKAGIFEVVPPPWTPESLSAVVSKALRHKGTVFEVIRPVESAKGLWALAGVVLLIFVLAAGYGIVQKRLRLARMAVEQETPTSWTLPYAHPGGLAFNGKQLWITDWFSQSLVQLDASDLRVARTRHFPREVPGALAFAGDALWIAAAPRSIAKHMLDDRLSVLSSARDAAPQTLGMAYDGLYLWTCDSKRGRLHKRILDEELSIVSSHDYPGGKPSALTFDGKSLWSLDAANRALLRHDLSRPERVTMRLPLPQYRKGGWKATGIAFDGTRFWSVAESLERKKTAGRIFVHEVPEERLEKILRP